MNKMNLIRRNPLIAILRGVLPQTVESIAEVLYSAGFRVIEVPLNSPNALDSIERLHKQFKREEVVIGAGTVLNPTQVADVHAVGGQIIISPNLSLPVIQATKKLDMLAFPGVMTPSEALSAIDNGADGLKYFPCETLSPSAIKAQRAILPKETWIAAVGGIGTHNMQDYADVGVQGFGFGSALFTPKLSLEAIEQRATAIVQTWQRLAN